MTTIVPKQAELRVNRAAAPERARVVSSERRQSTTTVDAMSRARTPVQTPSTKLIHALDEAIAWLRLTPLSELPEAALAAFTERMPKIDLHRHLNGAIPVDLLLQTGRAHELALPGDTVEALRPHVQVTDLDKTLDDYLAKFNVIGKVLKSPEIIESLAVSAIEEAKGDNLIHTELRFAPQFMAGAHGLDLEDVIKAVCSGVKRGVQSTGVTARLIVIVARNGGVDEAAVVAKLAAKYKHLGVVGLDLAGPEAGNPPGRYGAVFRDAAKRALCITIHAAEDAGPENAESAVVDCGAKRVGHFARGFKDPRVVALFHDLGIAIESCITSNEQTGAIESFSAHHFAEQLRAGLKQFLATDNPSISGITLSREFFRAITAFELTLAEVEQIQKNTVDATFLKPRELVLLNRRMNRGMREAEEALVRGLDVETLLTVLDATMTRHDVGPASRAAILARIREGLTG